ncbi:MAG: hypothetical protein AAF219_07535 [Myxococcota bacterium]
MRLSFEDWLDHHELPAEGTDAFRESLTCYKAGGFRAALMMSYLGFLHVARYRILMASPPDGFSANEWSGIQAQLRDDAGWDAKTYDCFKQKKPAPIFGLSASIERELDYWRDRRNDCAHLKQHEIAQSHVDSFWAFLRAHLSKIVPNGSRADLIERIKRHYDPNYTAPNSDPKALALTVQASVGPADYHTFFSEVAALPDEAPASFMKRRFVPEFLTRVLQVASDAVTQSLNNFLRTRPELLADVVREDPHLVPRRDPQFVRNLWREKLGDRHGDLHVYATLLREGLIPSDQIAEANREVILRLHGETPRNDDVPELEAAGFVSALRFIVFDKESDKLNEFVWGNRNASVIRWVLCHEAINEHMAARICSVFASDPFPFAVRDMLNELFETSNNKRLEFLALADRHQLALPGAVDSLFD